MEQYQEKHPKNLEASTQIGSERSIFLEKSLSAALDSFDNLFCRRCLVLGLRTSCRVWFLALIVSILIVICWYWSPGIWLPFTRMFSKSNYPSKPYFFFTMWNMQIPFFLIWGLARQSEKQSSWCEIEENGKPCSDQCYLQVWLWFLEFEILI